MKLVLVHTPSQAKRLTDVLGEDWRVEPCYGMVRELPTDSLGIAIENEFSPMLAIQAGRTNLLRRLMKTLRGCEAVYAATPPTLEGEAMAWHVLALSSDAEDKSVYRVELPALTPDAIRTAFAAPRPLDMKRVEAHMTRCIVDRLINWSINAQAKQAVGFNTALTYDGMIGLRLLADLEDAIVTFTPQNAWRTSVTLENISGRFNASVMNAKGAPLTLRSDEQAAQLRVLLQHGTYWVDQTGQAKKTYSAPAPLTLQTLIEIAERDIGLPPDRVLLLLTTLYEAGWITHPHGAPLPGTSETAHAYIRREYGTDYDAPSVVANVWIAPADVNRVPEVLPGDGAALYALVWKHFVAAHMTPAQERITAARILVGVKTGKAYPVELRATAKRLYFDGWRRVLPNLSDDAPMLPSLAEGSTLHMVEVVIETTTGEPSLRFTRAALVGALIKSGLTVQDAASTVEGLLAAQYVVSEDALTLTARGRVLADYLASSFGELTSSAYAADLHADIGRIVSGEYERLDVLQAFWSRFGDRMRPAPALQDTTSPAEHKPIVLRPVEEV